jgi:hypothetical protein
LRRFFSLAFAGILLAAAGCARAQQIDLAVGGGTLWSPKSTTASEAFTPPPEKGGIYPQFSAQYILDNHFGVNIEGGFRYKYGVYNDYQKFRPILYDANLVWAPPLAHKTTGNFMVGVGGETLIYYNQYAGCAPGATNCRVYDNSNHFLLHAGVGIRYSVWRGIFVRPEAHWNYIPDNFEFHSNNVFRIGVSVGYTFGKR